ncbi:winged helix-turn-helix domain-containing protein [Aneurinibacillus tyrosinisolvens]|uniref:winged helix-turn-helix domain-containing protein n=1 Tax=Aneurinibacillus tyrosinisolvens TaxID=1443435 RepID=UPI0009E3368F
MQLFIQNRFGVSMSRTGILRMLYRMGFRYQRSGYKLVKANAAYISFFDTFSLTKHFC